MAFENDAVLAEAIHYAKDESHHLDALGVWDWEAIRNKRPSETQDASAVDRKLWHCPDSLEQAERNATIEQK